MPKVNLSLVANSELLLLLHWLVWHLISSAALCKDIKVTGVELNCRKHLKLKPGRHKAQGTNKAQATGAQVQAPQGWRLPRYLEPPAGACWSLEQRIR